VQEIVRIANRFKVPIYPISTGRNLGMGGSAPTFTGSVVLDLKRMNRVLEVSERNAYALVEPGVSYFDLYQYIQERKLKVWLDVPDPGWGGLVGNSLDRGGGSTMGQFRHHFDAHCGMEVVLPNGDLMRTGMGAMPGCKSWQEFKCGFGPWVDGLFSQSNFGVVTKMGFWLMPEPEAYFNATVSVPNYEDLIPLIDTLNYLENSQITQGLPELMSPVMGMPAFPGTPATSPELRALVGKAIDGDSSALDAHAKLKGLPAWSLRLKFFGPAKAIAAQWEYCVERFSRIPGANFAKGLFVKLPLTPEEREQVHKPEFGIPTLSTWAYIARNEHNMTPTWGHQGFSPIAPRSGEAVFAANRVFARAGRELGLPVPLYSIPFFPWQRSLLFLFMFPVMRTPEENGRLRNAIRQLILLAAEAGFGEYRAAPAYQDLVMSTYSFNNHALLRFNESLKDAIDPNGIMSPGRYGIWPRHLRTQRS
jgi:4-cresol dehydrogenase (hydroxylating)